jgi:nucleotide-binding universal stress UspA family protein
MSIGSLNQRNHIMTGLFHKILVPIDFSPCSDEAFKTALNLARGSESELIMLHVIDTDAIAAFNRLGLLAVPSDATAQQRRMRHKARLKCRQLLASIPTKGVAVRRIILEGTPFVEIGKFTRQEGVDLIVVGSYGGRSESMNKLFFGATAEKVVRTAGCPVLTVPLPRKGKQ